MRVVAANWRPDDTRVKNAFMAKGFSVADPLRARDRPNVPTGKRAHKDLADTVIEREIYDRLLEEREGSNDTIDIYVIASGDGRFLEFIKDFVENKNKKFRVLARRDHSHLNPEYLEYERVRKKVAATPGRSPEPDFQIDDLATLVPQPALVTTVAEG